FHRQITQVTSSDIEKRIAGLKEQLRQEIREAQNTPESTEPAAKTTSFKLPEYDDFAVTESDKILIKPIMEYHHKTKTHYYNTVKGNLTTKAIDLKKITPKKLKRFPLNKNNNMNRVTPANVSLHNRRFHLDEDERNKPQMWTHCLDLITPRLKGYKDDWSPKEVLAHLLSLNTSEYTKEEIISTLYQISNLKLRIFQWDYTALTTIFNIIITEPMHNFRSLKNGLKRLFKSWHLDTSMITTFLKQTRIFRPPCIEVSHYGGSTKTTGGVRVSKPTRNQNKKKNDDDDCED
ncbi:hypothetical protein HW555_005888, partial [Spodoptera exigua]